MKKIVFTLLFYIFTIGTTASYYETNIGDFINSPNVSDLEGIEDEFSKNCEEIFLRAYMRREFTNTENKFCSDIFAIKIEAEMNYKRQMLGNRGIY